LMKVRQPLASRSFHVFHYFVHRLSFIAGCIVLNAVPVSHMVQAHSGCCLRFTRQQGCPTIAAR
jgi:hypothetical protein